MVVKLEEKYSHLFCLFFTLYYTNDISNVFKNFNWTLKNDGIVCLDSAASAVVIGDNSISANYSSAKLYIRSGTHTQTSANTDMIQLSLYDRNSQRNGAEGSGSWKSKIQFLAAQINGGAREGAFIQQDIKYNNEEKR